MVESSRSNDVKIFNQLSTIMESLMEFKTEMRSENIKMMREINASSVELNNNLNTSLNEFKTEMKSENIKMMREINASTAELKSEINASNIELKTEIKADINEINNRFNKQDEKLGDLSLIHIFGFVL